MKPFKSWRLLLRKKGSVPVHDGSKCGFKMKQLPFMVVICIAMLFIVYRTTKYQYRETLREEKLHPFDTLKEDYVSPWRLSNLPRGIIQARSDLELKPLWSSTVRSKTDALRNKVEIPSNRHLLAMAVGAKQKDNVDDIVQRVTIYTPLHDETFLPANFTIVLFHYDGKVDTWHDFEWSEQAIHIIAKNQTKWWFAKRFLHPSVVSKYDYIFLWDEDLGVEHFDPERYLHIVKSEGLEISQPALDPNSSEIHHRITIRSRTKKFHRRVYESRGSTRCSNTSWGPPCTGFVEGMAPVFSRSAWFCTWHLLQNDLVHGWGLDIKLGYCAQGDRAKNVGVIDREYIVHQGIQTLGGGGPPGKKATSTSELNKKHSPAVDPRLEIRRHSTWELQVFKERWNKAVAEDKNFVDPFPKDRYINVIGRRRTRRRGSRRE